MVTGNIYERSRCEMQRVFVGVAVDKRDAVVSSHRAPQEGTKPRNLLNIKILKFNELQLT